MRGIRGEGSGGRKMLKIIHSSIAQCIILRSRKKNKRKSKSDREIIRTMTEGEKGMNEERS